MVWQHLISIIDKENSLGQEKKSPTHGNMDGKLNKRRSKGMI